MNCEKIWNCEKCENDFGNGKDFCRGCGFDLNVWNEEESDDEENHCCIGCENQECEFVDEAWFCKECLEARDIRKLQIALEDRVEIIGGMLKELIDPKYGGVCLRNLWKLNATLSNLGQYIGDEFDEFNITPIQDRLYKLEEKYK